LQLIVQRQVYPLKVIFSLPFQPGYGRNLLIVGSTPELGQGDVARGLRMRHQAARFWTAEIHLSAEDHQPFAYRYAIEDQNGVVLQSEGRSRRFMRPECPRLETVNQRDFWRSESDPDAILSSAPFRKVIFRRRERLPVPDRPDCASQGVHICLRVPAAEVPPGSSLYVTGNIPALGFWNPEKALPLHDCGYPDWQVDFHARPAEIPFQYKYFIADPQLRSVTWESGDNRRLTDHDLDIHEENQAIVISDYSFRFSGSPWKGAGLAIPVFSLRTAGGLGVGEFLDLKPLADWAKQLGLQMIQLLPVNDTSVRLHAGDAYPYATLSVFALHPLYLNLPAIEGLSESMLHEIEAAAEQFNQKDVVDYEAVMSAKWSFLKRIFTQQARDFLHSAAFQAFFKEHQEWLRPYAAFCCLRDRHGTSDYREWGKFRRPTLPAIEQLTGPDTAHAREIALHYFIQYHLHRQLLEASEYARDRGVVLKGDIPIGVDKSSVETWLHPEWFNMDKSAGAPPDDFAVQGQNWGFPTYHWEAMAADGYSWWKKRLGHLSRYFDAIRLDHVIGFFRIWKIAADAVTALKGRFHPAIPLSRTELESAGIKDIDSLCEAHITDGVLESVFGNNARKILGEYLEPSAAGRYRFRPAFASQKELAAHFFSHSVNGKEESIGADHDILKDLLRLHDDVVLIPDKPGDRAFFHPRIALDLTCTFAFLDGQTQRVLRRFYEDYFFERQESLWAQGAREKLSALKTATDMLICGEDLGMVPRCVAGVMESLGLLGLRIQRMPAEPGTVFSDPAAYPYLTIASPSSHDMSTLRDWWEEADRAAVQLYYSQVLGHAGIAPKTCESWICRQVIALYLNGNSMWAVFPIQEILGMSADLRRLDPRQERINVPAVAQHRWNFRLHRTIGELLSQESFNADVSQMVIASGRLSSGSLSEATLMNKQDASNKGKTHA
jgi:4-alpha-glucanotransferase